MKFFIIFLLLSTTFSKAQISPGDLTDAHANLEGMSNCTKCHVIGEKVTNAKCLDCHDQLKNLINEGKGYHSSNEVKGKECIGCHSEHHGRKFRIVNFDKNKFNHDRTTFKLSGKHAEIDCEDCHNSKFITNNEIKKRKGTFLGLETNCISCHEDFHQNTLSSDCNSCHNTAKFKPAVNFNHDKTAFRLTGSHKKIDCEKCHQTEKRNGKNFIRFKNIEFGNCSSCHTDPHKGRFGDNCENCHNTMSFHQTDKLAFNHDKTDYPLRGKHIDVSCNSCHKNNLTKKLKHEECIDCHSDYHKGDFVVNSKIRDCSDCHTVNGFLPSLYTIDQHNQVDFRLTGGHLAVPCRNCHMQNNEWHFKNIGKDCIDCHKNIHGTEISSSYMKNNNCESCHNSESWASINFDHDRTGFKLLGKHKSLSCNSCHYRSEIKNIQSISSLAEKIFQFASIKSNCEECHDDVHYGQFKSGETSQCERCHSFENWKPDKFNHNNTTFLLKGAHLKVECKACHKPVTQGDVQFIQYKIRDYKCAACHS